MTNFIEVEVDTETGQIRPLRAVAAVDAGTFINPDLVAGQLEGASSGELVWRLWRTRPMTRRRGS